MKITKAQKEAIVSEIIRRLNKEEKSCREKFDKEYSFTKEEKEVLKACKEYAELDKKYQKVKEDTARLLQANNLGCYVRTEEAAKAQILSNRYSHIHTSKAVDFSEVRDRLEFATLDPEFKVEDFIKMYL